MSFLISNASDQRKYTRQRLKKQVREKYGKLKSLIEHKLSSAITNDVMLEIKSSSFDIYSYDYELALFIIIKKLESKGYKVEHRKGNVIEHKDDELASTYFKDDKLFISW